MVDKVSIIIPLYNSVSFLGETLQSVLNQSYINTEIVIVDDGSTDGSFEFALTYVSQKIKVLKNKGKGACAARNYGFELSTGDYIQFLDADDILSLDKIERQVEALKGRQDLLAVCNTVHFIDAVESGICTDEPYLFSTSKPEEFFIKLWGGNELPMNMVQTSAWLTPRLLIENHGLWNESLAKDQDGEFFARLGLNGNGIVYVPVAKNYYRKFLNGNNIASGKSRVHLASNLKSTQLKEVYLFGKTHGTQARSALAIQFKQLAIDAWPEFKDISEQAIRASNKLGGSNYEPAIGGRIVEMVKNLFGWKCAKSMSYYWKKRRK
ncbi:glycosyltransferase (GT2) [Formosa agariphila KMM 3901]|uniref:Glycosyltransferase (GT2) n=1 Tax=Formosa agariphila (strain DSM 15362 / KCTC 12365 / LMG 23005 / KMM 3901 / M-2Alg 35-1) TaxID=1347342 RepID=T2KP48_FORAG|nr:glycosyltransferase [Formosa agariphila]CDF80632.1 glycosyltransferase (GT2) [Formosa agariphila KMM 3901]